MSKQKPTSFTFKAGERAFYQNHEAYILAVFGSTAAISMSAPHEVYNSITGDHEPQELDLIVSISALAHNRIDMTRADKDTIKLLNKQIKALAHEHSKAAAALSVLKNQATSIEKEMADNKAIVEKVKFMMGLKNKYICCLNNPSSGGRFVSAKQLGDPYGDSFTISVDRNDFTLNYGCQPLTIGGTHEEAALKMVEVIKEMEPKHVSSEMAEFCATNGAPEIKAEYDAKWAKRRRAEDEKDLKYYKEKLDELEAKINNDTSLKHTRRVLYGYENTKQR